MCLACGKFLFRFRSTGTFFCSYHCTSCCLLQRHTRCKKSLVKGIFSKKYYLSCIAKVNLLFIVSFFPWLVFVNLSWYYASTNGHMIYDMSKQNSPAYPSRTPGFTTDLFNFFVWICVAHLLSFLCFVCHRFVSCVQCCLSIWIVHYGFPLRLSRGWCSLI
jgi:hypothetical protein